MEPAVEDLLRTVPIFRALGDDDRRELAAVARMQLYERGDRIFDEGAPPEVFHTIVRGRAKVYKTTLSGKDVILEIFGPGDPIGAVAVYKEVAYPATAEALEDCVCLEIPRRAFFALLRSHPSLVRGLLLGLTRRLVELTNRIAVLTGARIEPRFARLFLKLAEETGKPADDGTFIPLRLSRQELADLTGTTIETAIRIMSRWGKEGIVATEDDGFRVLDDDTLRTIAAA